MGTSVPVLLLSGTVGVGKTTLAYEIGEELVRRSMPHAVVDIDAIAAQWPPSSRWNSDLLFENLALLWPSYRKHGATRLVLAHVLEDGSERARYLDAVPGAELTVVRVVAPEDVRLQRLRSRMSPGPSLDWHLDRTVELDAVLDRVRLEDLTVDNGDRPVADVAVEVLTRAGWI